MNPVDHPHGGATSGGKLWVTPWVYQPNVKRQGKRLIHGYFMDKFNFVLLL